MDDSDLLIPLLKAIVPPLLGGYLLGSIPFGLILTKLAGQGDIRQIGSGNIGATNVLRTGKKGLAALTLLLDGGKGALAVFIGHWIMQYYLTLDPPVHRPALAALMGLGAVLGHVFPIWLRFKGGKGVATALGVFLALAWPVGVAGIVTWLLVAIVFRMSSLAALFAMALTPAYAFYWAPPNYWVLITVIVVLVIAKHHGNIRRIIKGQEPRIGKSG